MGRFGPELGDDVQAAGVSSSRGLKVAGTLSAGGRAELGYARTSRSCRGGSPRRAELALFGAKSAVPR